MLGQNAKQHIKAGEQFLANGLTDAALVEFNKAISLDPDDGKTYHLKAALQLYLKDSLNAADSYRKAAALDYVPVDNYLKAAKIYAKLGLVNKTKNSLESGLNVKPKNSPLLLFKTEYYFMLDDFNTAFTTANEAIKSKDNALAYFYSGASAYKLGQFDRAKRDLEKAIIRDRNFKKAYLKLAEMQIELKQYEYAIDNCSMVLLLLDPRDTQALYLRSLAFHAQREPDQALLDITKAISLNKDNWFYYSERARYNMDYANYSRSIDDYSIVISMNDTSIAYISRALAYEKLGKNGLARKDYSYLLSLTDNTTHPNLYASYQKKIFDLGKEENKPLIRVDQPVLTTNFELEVKENVETIRVKGVIKEETQLGLVKLNNKPIEITQTPDGFLFNEVIKTSELEYITLTATDIYENTSSVSYPIRLIETQAPKILLISPTAGSNEAIALESGDSKLYIEGKIQDKSRITEIKVDEVNASFAPGDYNPKFTATIDVKNRQNITITAKDAFGNVSTQKFEFIQEGKLLSGNSAMGKTWVVIIENTDYKQFSSLSSSKEDIPELKNAFSRYKISKILHKKNLSKRELERFFAIDLRDLIISNKVKSLLIWYAGHGQTMNNTGYWIPVDGRLNDEYSFYNVNALKASLYSYTSLTHLLIVSDACRAGESFSIAMRGDNSLASCNEARLIQQKSALILTSSNTEPALDNSLFTKTFANSLANNPADCIPIDAIADRISIVLYKHNAQKTVFGRINGLENKNGTFFFMSR